MGYRKLAKLLINLLLLAYIRNLLVLAIADERLLRDGAGKPRAVRWCGHSTLPVYAWACGYVGVICVRYLLFSLCCTLAGLC